MTATSAEPIALIGSAFRFPGDSDTPSKLWELLRNPRDLLRKIPEDRFDADAFYHPDGRHHGTSNVRHSYFVDQDPGEFDNGFFNIPVAEAEAIDPQQRMLMETVYDSLCAGGQTIEELRGSPTSVFVGLMCDDWSGMMGRDIETYPQYAATGTARSIMSNRISYFFDWHGPCMTIDTACSSSLVAVHQAIQTLHSGESKVAIAAGANLILSPGRDPLIIISNLKKILLTRLAAMYVAESKLSMLSPNGRSRMWDKDVDGYARGEGIAAVVLKTLSAAIRDNDNIECIIRATGVNQDGRTPGITMPSGTAQAALIRDTYRRAGLDIEKPEDRPQFFHAHGTGTAAGDPEEAQAISTAFYSKHDFHDKLYVGSIKTVIGHTEGTAGLASLIATSLALQNKTIPPNMHFNTLNPKLEPFYRHLEVPTQCIPWKESYPGQPRRASINSFGFGGTNAHAILEEYKRPENDPRQLELDSSHSASKLLFSPLTFSAASELSLNSMLSSYLEYLQSNPNLNLHDLAYSLQSRTSTLPYRVAIKGPTKDDICDQFQGIIGGQIESTVETRQLVKQSQRILGVFTGQGSQWARMGARLLESSPFMARRMSELDTVLAGVPIDLRPSWKLQELILAHPEDSRINDAAISQPVCTAVQIVLVDLLNAARVKFDAVVGHSSGEIGAAYAAGLLTDRDAIRVAYFRGLYANLAKSPNSSSKGSMMAVGTTLEDATEFCELEDFEERIQIAAQNSPSSITLSGDEDAVVEAVAIYNDEGRFARQLKVDTAYHSAHVAPCAESYRNALELCELDAPSPTGIRWYSSVQSGHVMEPHNLDAQYWIDNMVNPVLFSSAVTKAWTGSGPFDIILEVGPHPVLKTPCLDTIETISGHRPPYSGVLRRGANDVEVFSDALGFVWTELGAGSVDFRNFECTISENDIKSKFLPTLPKYPFDHSKKFMSLSRGSGLYRNAQGKPHPLLGRRCQDRETLDFIQWRNILSAREISWLKNHQIENQTILPAAGYVCMAIEAISDYAKDSKIGLIGIRDFHIDRAIVFNDNSPEIETLINLRIVSKTDESVTAEFSCSSGAVHERKSMMAFNTSGTVEVKFASLEPDALPPVDLDDLSLSEVDSDRFYNFLSGVGYNYTEPFRGITEIRRKADYATGRICDQSGSDWEDSLIVHPGMLDTALQTAFAAFCCPGDERLWSLHVPTGIRSMLINPYFTHTGIGKQTELQYVTATRQDREAKIYADIHLSAGDSNHTFLQIEGTELVPLTPTGPSNDALLFSRLEYKLATPDADSAALNFSYTQEDIQLSLDEERIAFYYFRQLLQLVTMDELDRSVPYYRHLLNYAKHMVPLVSTGQHACVPACAQHDTEGYINDLIAKHPDEVSVRFLQSVGKNLPQAVKSGSSMLEHMFKDSMMDRMYDLGFGVGPINDILAHVVGQISHRYPHMNLLEIAAFSIRHRGGLKKFEDRMIFKTFDMVQSPESQGFDEGSYDVVIASNVLHISSNIQEAVQNLRRLLKPGGYAVILDVAHNESLRISLTMGSLPGWWLGAESGRVLGPALTLPQWDTFLSNCGFGGIDTATPSFHATNPLHVFCAQAVNERVEILRAPLTHPARLKGFTPLVIVGGRQFETHRICGQLVSMVGPMFASVHRFVSIEEMNSSGLAEGSTVLSLTELDEPLLAMTTPQKIDALKTIWRQAKNILWVVNRSRGENAYSQMVNGIARCIRHEYPAITLQILDFDCITKETASMIADSVSNLQMLSNFSIETHDEDIMWSLEPEVYIENGVKLIPRLLPCDASNKRYNTTRRVVTEDVDPQKTDLTFASEEDRPGVQQHSPLRIHRALSFICQTRRIRVTHFLLSSLSIVSGAYLRLCIGVDTATQERLFFASSMAESSTEVPADWCIALDQGDPIAILNTISSYLLARSITQSLTGYDTLLLHDPHSTVVQSLHKMLEDMSISLQVTTSKRNAPNGWLYVDKNFSQRRVKDILPAFTTKFLDLSSSSMVSEVITKCLPRNCHIIDSATLLYPGIELRAFVSAAEVAAVLKEAWDRTIPVPLKAESLPVVPLATLTEYSAAGESRFSIIDCTGPSVKALVRPIDDGMLFRPDRTYFMVGLSGELGQSLCKWMVVHGARHVVLTSRNPKVDPRFISLMKRMGADMRIMPMDVTSHESAQHCYETVVKTMPPIAGVANGAMVLRDTPFENLDYDDFMTVLNPKVQGSLILEDLFHDAPLDFFIFFSSTAAVKGNRAQSNYAAANQFMHSLAAKRKKRGAAASVINIGAVIGIGYVERDDVVNEFTFARMGFRPIAEQDIHHAFAEAMLVGNPAYTETCEVVTGISPLNPDDRAVDFFFSDLKFSHFVSQVPAEQATMSKTANNQPVKVQLAKAKTKIHVLSIIQDSFLARLRRILQLPQDDPINEKLTFVEQGIDSLMAVEVRSWFLKELGVDFAILRILGGSSITEFIDEAAKMLPSSIVDISKLAVGQKETAKIEMAQPEPESIPRDEARSLGVSGEIPTSSGSSSDTSSDGDDSSLDTSKSGTFTPDLSLASTPVTPMLLSPTDFIRHPASQLPGSALPDELTYPLSYNQSAFWFLNEYLTDKTTLNMTAMFKVTGLLRIMDLEEAVTLTVKRHDILRTRFLWTEEADQRRPVQAVTPKAFVGISQESIESEAEANGVLERVGEEPWDSSSSDAAKVLLLELSDEIHFLIISMNHIMADSYSFAVLLRDIGVAYSSGILPKLPAESQYRYFVSQQRGLHEVGGTQASIQYFQDTLAPSSAYLQPIQLLPFAKSTTRQRLSRHSQEEAEIQIDSVLKSKLRSIAKQHQSTSFHVYLSALQLLLFNLLPRSTQDIFIGIADANRRDGNFQDSIGLFLNLLPLRFHRSSANATIASVIQTARDATYGALSNSQVPFDVLLQELNIPRSNNYTPLFQVFLEYKQLSPDRPNWGECTVNGDTWINMNTGYDLFLDVNEYTNTGCTINLRLQDTLYSKKSAELLLRSYVKVLEYIADASDATVGGVPTWSEHDIQPALAAGSQVPLQPRWEPTLSARLDKMIEENDTRIALKDGNEVVLNYEQMGARIDYLTNTLLASGVEKGTVVGVLQEPSTDWICSLLSVLRAGCIYLPLDLKNSVPRLASIVKLAKPSIMLTDRSVSDKVAMIDASHATEFVVSDMKTPEQVEKSRNLAERDAPAVLLFTSGTTGEPKGVILRNENLIANAEASSLIYPAGPDLVVLQQTAFSFDFSLDQVLAALTNGGCLYVVPSRIRGDPIAISQIMLEEKITYTSSTPSEFDLWLRYASEPLSRCHSWRFAFLAGESMSRNLALEFHALKLSQLRVFNGFGPTEGTCIAAKIELDYQFPGDPVPDGFPMPGYTCVIVDESLQPVPAAVSGEILLGGPCVASGYLNNPDATREKFIPDSFFGTSKSMYRTGDRGRLLADGTLYCEGRLAGDTQIKLRGFRIELGEIERSIVKHSDGAISQAIVTLRGTGEESYLAAHVVFALDLPVEARERTIQVIRRSLPLPSYMRPSAIIAIDDIPRTAHLKIDRRAIQELPIEQIDGKEAHGEEAAVDLTDAELKLSELWRQIMPLDPGPLTADSEFFLVGGSSILLVRLQHLLTESFGAAPELVSMMGAPILGEMSAVIEASRPSFTIDWEAEAELPEWAVQHNTDRSQNNGPITILLTGSTGYIGRHLQPILANDEKISRVFCLSRGPPTDSTNGNPKVSIIQTDISQPNLGISDELYATLIAEVDIIVHCAANRSFWDRYEVLRPDNYDSIKELAQLATMTARSAPLHVFSSGAVATYDNSSLPPQDGSEGYLSTKWVAEKFLRKFAEVTRISVYIHRPEPQACLDTTQSSSSVTAVLDQLINISVQLGLRPTFHNITGSVHLQPVDPFVQSIHKTLHDSLGADSSFDCSQDHFKILHHEATLRVSTKDIEERFNQDDSVRGLPGFPCLEWFGKAKRVGLSYVFTSWELVMGSDSQVVTRR
ncbi:lovastatin nonaketide synthase [Penicillium malachiteum]|uniref:lovastatin nonaketide synthase n=1 Tax=Penicillium malachiteum TaxID=1324776 RepID=UPI002547FC20|nr:lovastatin nonaketide synthase [Penicillium malachiteum]KAJ5737005.1 lovastatin nonaketide synthase [Penicillium malachiteum]